MSLTIVGLSLDLVGVAMLFKWPPLAPEHESPAFNRVGKPENYEELQAKRLRDRAKYQRLSWLALGLIALGFTLQIADQVMVNWL